MKIIIPENEKNHKIAFDFRDAFDAKELVSWIFVVEMFINKEEARLNRPLTKIERDAVKTYFKRTDPLDIENCILVLDKKCVDKRFKNMSNKDIYDAFKNKLIDVKELEFVKNLDSTATKNNPDSKSKLAIVHKAIHKKSTYSVEKLASKKGLTVEVPLWANSSQLVDYHEHLDEAPNGSDDYVIKFKYSGIKKLQYKNNNKNKEELERCM